MTKKEKIAWAAGLFDGEGCITVKRAKYKDKVYEYPCLSLCSVDRDLVDRFHEILGGSEPWIRKAGYKRQEIYLWQVSGKKAKEVIVLIYPFLCKRRKKRADEIFNAT